jgi:hypothetical protein
MQENNHHKVPGNSQSSRLHRFFRLLRSPRKLFSRIKINLLDADLKKKSYRDQFRSYQHAIKTLALLSAEQKPGLEVQTLQSCGLAAEESDSAAIRLKELFLKFGSDKSDVHNYHLLYAGLLNLYPADLAIFEMGLGTNHLEMKSNMGPEGNPGASLRAFREMYPHAFIYGADIDKRILFNEDRIKTFYANQLEMDSLTDLQRRLFPLKFQLIIDDGLHTPEANINMFRFAIDMLTPDGVFVIEDIKESDIDFFLLAGVLLYTHFDFRVISTQAAYICVVKKRNSPQPF